MPRLGTTAPITFTPILVSDTLTPLAPITHSFELLDLPTEEYQFAIGKDLIGTLFPQYVYTSLLTKTKSNHPVTENTVSFKSTTLSTLEGHGSVPWEETPIRVSTDTSSDENALYTHHREQILKSPEIQHLLHANESITGFCNVKDSVLNLHLDPVLGTPKKLYSRQYNIPHALQARADEVVQRWIQSG